MIIKSAEFTKSSPSLELCPNTNFPEFAFIGRSNVGKSSLINMLVNRTSLAKTAAKPGKTRLINHFLINNNWYLVDLPGYGYASASKTEIKNWNNFISDFLLKRENLSCLFVLVDSRLEPQKIDIQFINNLGELQIPFVIISTKSDKVSKLKVQNNFKLLIDELKKTWEIIPEIIISSSKTKEGRDAILDIIDKTIKEWDYNKSFI
ncbi:MAG: YihA family ribosome biogenesis GTP-binding protein [Bacteroidetes bacterium]|nr:YihA family ribosome biogenesis GTP-binding protein [Bacteroidota bacterium]PIX33051.1 MAG: YihA family ribosome biogenesis GTP-binding protein [Bacteroidetes bacterium CG_4_8_14_3_um_filter_31_14]